jgi:hypothetical protein
LVVSRNLRTKLNQNPQGQQQNGNTQGFGGFKQTQTGNQQSQQSQSGQSQGFGFKQNQGQVENGGQVNGFKQNQNQNPQVQVQSGFGFNKQNQQGQTLTVNQGFTGGFKQTQTGNQQGQTLTVNQGFTGGFKQNQNQQGQTLTVNQSDQQNTTQQGQGVVFGKTNQFSGNGFTKPQSQSGNFLQQGLQGQNGTFLQTQGQGQNGQKQGGFSGFKQDNGNLSTQNQGFSGFNKESQNQNQQGQTQTGNQQGQTLTVNQGFTQNQVPLPMTGFVKGDLRTLPESGFIKPQTQEVQLPPSGFIQKDNQVGQFQHNGSQWQNQNNGSQWQASEPQNRRTEQNQGYDLNKQSQNQNGFRMQGYTESTQLPFHKEQKDISISNPYGKSKYTDLNSNFQTDETNGSSLVRPLPNYKITPRKSSSKMATMVKQSSQSKMIQPSSESPLFDQKKRAEIWGKSFPEEGISTPYKSKKVNQIRLRDDLPIIPEGYYSVPSVEEMSSMPSLENLPFFTLGRKDFGEITFDGEVDVSNVDFSNIVSINKLTIQVYPDQTTKPRIGEGFNRKSILKLFNCYPMDKQGLRIADEKSMRSFQSKLQRKTEEFGDYISYEPSSGTWSFQVDHF